jgi:hypothetical protein
MVQGIEYMLDLLLNFTSLLDPRNTITAAAQDMISQTPFRAGIRIFINGKRLAPAWLISKFSILDRAPDLLLDIWHTTPPPINKLRYFVRADEAGCSIQ